MHKMPVTGNVARQVSNTAFIPSGPAAAASKPQVQNPERGTMKRKQPDAVQTAPKQTHAHLMAELRQADEPLSVGGSAQLNLGQTA